MFSQTLEYALRAVVCLAQNEERSLTTQQISSLADVPVSYLSKVLQMLSKANLITATRGLGGGHALKVPADELSILQVVNAVEPIKRITKCPLGIGSHGTNLCPLHARLDQVMANAEEAFRTTSIADLLADPSRSTPLCEKRMVKLGILRK